MRSLIIVLLFAVGCGAAVDSSLVERLRSRGPVVLSAENPFLSGNLFLADQMDRSKALRDSVSENGPPPALEIKDNFSESLQLLLYYPVKSQFNLFELVSSEWIFKGSFPISDPLAKNLGELLVGIDLNPGKVVAKSKALKVAVKPTVVAASKKATQLKPRIKSRSQATDSDSITANNPDNSAQDTASTQSKVATENQAELTPRGDLVHYVTFEGETLRLLVRWYVQDLSSLLTVARVNKRDPSQQLLVGDTVIIPSRLIRNRARLSATALAALVILEHEDR